MRTDNGHVRVYACELSARHIAAAHRHDSYAASLASTPLEIFGVITVAGILFTVITEYEMTVGSCAQMTYCARLIYAPNGLARIQFMHIRQFDKRHGH